MKNLDTLRDEISQIDAQILELFAKRLTITDEVGRYKAENSLPIFQKNRENEILENISQNFADKTGITNIWKEVMNMSKRGQQKFFQKSENTIRIGIQWGEGSFNHIAIQEFLAKNPDFFAGKQTEIIFLYTTENVLENLNNGSIDCGQFAIANSIGGLVHETMSTLGAFSWKFLKNYHISVQHSILLHPEAKIENIDTIMWHEQAIRQCENNLQKLFPNIAKIGGTGELTDNASIAEAIANGKLPKNIACIGNKILADIYPLVIAKENIQDREDNETTFVLVGL